MNSRKRISFIQLLQKVACGSQPKKIYYDGHFYKWDEDEYYCNDSSFLIDFSDSVDGLKDAANDCWIEIVEPVSLSIRERKFLESIVELNSWDARKTIFKKVVFRVSPMKDIRPYAIYIYANCEGRNVMYPFCREGIFFGMEEDVEYTSEELGLFEDD